MRASIEMSQNSPSLVGDSLTQETSGLRVMDCNEPEAHALKQGGDILRELHTLLEDYAPIWYTERYHAGIEQILRDLKNLNYSRSTVPAR